ncbi:MAG: PLP-dependent aminotransferase family protein [Acidimicrobiales bacterium]
MRAAGDNSGANRSGSRIEAELRSLVAGQPAGSRLPSVRELSRRHRAGPVTVQRIITRLEREGLLDAVPGNGTFVARRWAAPVPGDVSWQTVALGARAQPGDAMASLAALAPAGTLSLAAGYPDASLWPSALLTAAAGRAARGPGAWDRTPAQGLEALRAWFAADAGPGVHPDDVLVVPGGQAALTAAFRGLASPGDPVVVEAPSYVGAIEAARAAGLHPVPVPADGEGVLPDLLAAVLHVTGARLIYLQTRLANPVGATLGPERREAVLALARSHGAFVIDDDFARDLDQPGGPAPLLGADPDGHVVYVRSLTKSTAPALRIAGVVVRGPALARLRNSRLTDDLFVSTMLQETALAVVTAPGWSRHLARLRRSIDERRRAAADALAAVPGLELVHRPTGGFLLWLRLVDGTGRAVPPEAAREADTVRRAREAGVMVLSGRPGFCAEPDGTYLPISVAGIASVDVPEAVARLATALV